MINYYQKVSMPIRDMGRDGRVVFVVDVYGVTPGDLGIVPGGGLPMRKAVERMGLDPNRYQASLFDIPINQKPVELVPKPHHYVPSKKERVRRR